MSKWRREASSHLPELQSLIASRLVDSPMMLWIELNDFFGKACEKKPVDIEFLRRFWVYCQWCLENGSPDVSTAAALGFCEHLLDSLARVELLPKIISRAQFLELKEILLYHNDEAYFLAALEKFT